MSKIEVDKVDPQSGTALEIGTSGDTVTVPSGVGLTLTDSTLLLPTTINTDKIDPKSGTALEIGTSGDTVTIPTGVGLTLTDSTLLLPTTITSTTEVKTNKISPATGTAFALGDSGDTFTVPSGATIDNLGTATGFGGGKILQVVTATDTTFRETTSTTFVTASNTLSVDITPASSSNKIFIIVTTISETASGRGYFTIYRDTTNLGTATGFTENRLSWNPLSMSTLDSPSSTSSITYQVYFRNLTGTVYLNNGNEGTITAFEIEG